MFETVHNLSKDIGQRNAELSSRPEPEEIHPKVAQKAFSPSPDVEHNVEILTINSETRDQDDITFNESEDLYNDEDTCDEVATKDKDNEENHREEETIGRNKKKNLLIQQSASP